MKTFAVILWTCVGIPALASITLVQHPTGNSSGAVSSYALAYTSNVTKGDLLAIGARWDASSSSDIATITDSQGNMYTQASIVFNSGSYQTGVFYAFAGSSGADTVTITPGATEDCALSLREYSATSGWPVNPVDNSQNSAMSGVASVAVNITTAYGNEVIYAFIGYGSAVSWSAGSGWTNVDNNTTAGYRNAAQDQLNVPPATYGSEGSISAAGTWSCVVVAFLEQGTGPAFPSII